MQATPLFLVISFLIILGILIIHQYALRCMSTVSGYR